MQRECAILSSEASLAPPYFSTLSHKRCDFRKNITEYKMCVLIFSTTFIRKISRSEKNSVRFCHECRNVFMLSTLYSFRILMKPEFSRQMFEKNSNIKFNENPSSGRRIFPCGRTDRHDETNSRFSQFCGFA